MKFNQRLQNQTGDESGLTTEDIAALSNYPSIGKLFDNQDSAALNEMKEKLNGTFQQLERVVLRGSSEESKQAKAASSAVKTTLDFLEMLEQMKGKNTNI